MPLLLALRRTLYELLSVRFIELQKVRVQAVPSIAPPARQARNSFDA
jgi:hypothetical protein